MSCPVCKGEEIPADCSMIEKQGKRVIAQGHVYAIIDKNKYKEAIYSPFSNFLTVSLYPRKGKVKYLKFRIQGELNKWPFEEGKSYAVQGCLHVADGKELVFDTTQVESLKSKYL